MIAIKVNDEFLDFLPSQAVTLTSVCPLFDRQRLDRVYTLPFTLPATARNLSALGAFNRLDSVSIPATSAELYIAGNLYERGFIRLARPGIQAAEFVFQGALTYLSARLERLRLRDLSIPAAITTPYAPTLVVGADLPTPLGSITSMTLGINDHIFTVAPGDTAGMIAAINAQFPGMATDAGGTIASPRIQLSSVPPPEEFLIRDQPAVSTPATHIFFNLRLTTYDSEADRINDAWLAYLATPNAFATFPPILATELYHGRNPDYSGYANYVDPDGDHPNTATPFTTGWAHTLLPQPLLSALWAPIAQAIQVSAITGSFVTDSEAATLTLWSNRPLDYVRHLNEHQEGAPISNPIHTYPPAYNLADHLPDITALDHLVRLANTFALFLFFDAGRIHLIPARERLTDQPWDWTHLADPSAPNATTDPFTDYSLDYDRQGDDSYLQYPAQLQRRDGGPEALEYIAGYYTLHYTSVADAVSGTRSWLVPITLDEGTSPYFQVSTPPTLRLMFYRGQQADSEGNTYPLASHHTQAYDSSTTGQYSLDWLGATGLYARWWSQYIQLTQLNHRITLRFRLTIAELLELRTWRHVLISVYTQHGQFVGAIYSIRVTITSQGIGLTDVTFLRL